MEKTTQKSLRAMIARGTARNAEELSAAELRDLNKHADKVAYAPVSIGLGGLLVQDKRDGELYAVASRCAALIILS